VFEYEPLAPAPEPDDAWHAAVAASIPAIQAVVERNERIADLRRLVAPPAPTRRGSAERGLRARARRGR
jgi:hypothetical protein